MRMLRGVVIGVFLFAGLLWQPTIVEAQTCSGTVGVECGSIVCLTPDPGGGCENNNYGCGAGLGWQQTLECSASYGQCKVDNVCAQAGMCQYSIAGQCTSGGPAEECPCGVNVNTGNCKACNTGCNIDGYGIDCPSGTVKTTEIVSSQCLGRGASCNLGTAQGEGSCCEEEWDECAEEAWIAGGWGCIPGYVCRRWTINTYRCEVPCNLTAPVITGFQPQINPTLVRVNWTPGTGTGITQQLLRVDEDLAEVNGGCPTVNPDGSLDCEAKMTFLGNTTSDYTVTGLTPGVTYYYRIVTYRDGSCYRSTVGQFMTPLPVNNEMSGTVYRTENNTCVTSEPVWNLGGLSVNAGAPAGTSVAVGNDGQFSVNTGSNSIAFPISLSGIPAGYECATGPGCPLCPTRSVSSPSSGNHFYLTPSVSRESWWQAVGAGIYAGGAGGVRSSLPSSSYRLIIAPLGGGTEGALITSSGSVSVGLGSVSESMWVARSLYGGRRVDYNFFATRLGALRGDSSDWFSDTLDLPIPDGRDFYYMLPSSGVASIEQDLLVSTGESYVILVAGDLNIYNNITVENGGFLAMIVEGSVSVDPSVTSLEGLYVMDDNFVSQSAYVEGSVNDVPLVVEGSIVSWGSTALARNLGSGNTTTPAEQFVYRPDLLINMPESMKTFLMRWEEVTAGSFE